MYMNKTKKRTHMHKKSKKTRKNKKSHTKKIIKKFRKNKTGKRCRKSNKNKNKLRGGSAPTDDVPDLSDSIQSLLNNTYSWFNDENIANFKLLSQAIKTDAANVIKITNNLIAEDYSSPENDIHAFENKTLLMLLAHIADPESMKILLEKLNGSTVEESVSDETIAYVNQISDTGETALMWALDALDETLKPGILEGKLQACIDCIDILLKYKADPNITLKFGTPLISAIRSGNFAVIKLLLDNGANPNFKSESNSDMPLIEAANIPNFDILELLLDKGADVNAESSVGKTALELVLNYDAKKNNDEDEENNKKCARLLIDRGADTEHEAIDYNKENTDNSKITLGQYAKQLFGENFVTAPSSTE